MKARAAVFAACALVGVVVACKRTPVSADPAAETKAASSATVKLASAPLARDGGAAADPRAQAFCREFHGTPAARRASCCSTGDASASVGRAASSGSGMEEIECTERLSAALKRGAVELDQAAADACLDARRKAVEGCDWVTPGSPTAPAACQGIVRGVVKADGACQSSLECESGLHCDASKCRVPAVIDASCANGVDFFASALGQYAVERTHPVCKDYCNGATHKCEAKPAVGAKCFTNAGCSEGAVCVNGACALGVAPRAGESCKTTMCADGLICSAGTCRERGKPGDACESDFDCSVGGCGAVAGAKAGKRVCGMTCSHAGDLDAIKRKLGAGH